MLKNLGTLVCIGIPKLDFHLPITPFEVIVRGNAQLLSHNSIILTVQHPGINIIGTTCIAGDENDVQALLQLALLGKIIPLVQVFEFSEVNAIKEKLESFQIRGRAVVKIPE